MLLSDVRGKTDSLRVGQFNILWEVLRDGSERPMLSALFALCEPVYQEWHESGRGKRLVAASELFQKLNVGDEIPTYRIEMVHNKPFDNPEWEQRRINSGDFGFVAIRQTILRVPSINLSLVARQI